MIYAVQKVKQLLGARFGRARLAGDALVAGGELVLQLVAVVGVTAALANSRRGVHNLLLKREEGKDRELKLLGMRVMMIVSFFFFLLLPGFVCLLASN